MKAILSLVAVMTLAACGTAKQDNNSSTAGFPGFTVSLPRALTEDLVVFAKDARPVDGALKVVTLNRNEAGKYDVSVRTAFVSRMTGESSDKTEEVAYALDCTENRGTYTCSADERPVDGALNVLTVEQDQFGYNATLTTTFFNRMTGVEESKEEILGSSLELIQALAAQ